MTLVKPMYGTSIGKEKVDQSFTNALDYINTPIEELGEIQKEKLQGIKDYIKSIT